VRKSSQVPYDLLIRYNKPVQGFQTDDTTVKRIIGHIYQVLGMPAFKRIFSVLLVDDVMPVVTVKSQGRVKQREDEKRRGGAKTLQVLQGVERIAI